MLIVFVSMCVCVLIIRKRVVLVVWFLFWLRASICLLPRLSHSPFLLSTQIKHTRLNNFLLLLLEAWGTITITTTTIYTPAVLVPLPYTESPHHEMAATAQGPVAAAGDNIEDAIEAKFHELFDAFVLQLRLGSLIHPFDDVIRRVLLVRYICE